MSSKRSKKVSIVEPARACIRPKTDVRPPFGKSMPPIKNFYGKDMSSYGMCPADAPYIGFKDGLYCCLPRFPTADEAYEYYSMLAQNIEGHKPGPEHIEHWRKWSGFPQSYEQDKQIADEITNPRKKKTRKDMRWLKTQFDPKGIGARTIQWVDEGMDEHASKAACNLLSRGHCNQRRDCLYNEDTKQCRKKTKADMQALQQAEKAAKQMRQKAARQARQQQERDMQHLAQWSEGLEMQMADAYDSLYD